MVNPGPVPHVGGPEISGSPNVIVGFQPQGRVGDTLICVPATDKVAMGSPTVLVNNKMAARMGDPTVHGGVLVTGCPTVIIGQAGQGATLSGAAKTGAPFCEECEKLKKAQEAAELKEPPAPNTPPADSAESLTDKGKAIIAAIKKKVDEVLPPEKRAALVHLIKTIKPVAEQALARGEGAQSVANWAVASREAIAEHYGTELESNGDLVAFVYERNKEKFGDALGPRVEWLMSEKGKTARDLIESAASGNFKEELTGTLVDQLSEQVIEDPRARELIRAAATNTLPDKLGELSGEVVDQAVGKLIENEETKSLLGPIIDYVKGEVSEKVVEKAGEILAGGAG